MADKKEKAEKPADSMALRSPVSTTSASPKVTRREGASEASSREPVVEAPVAGVTKSKELATVKAAKKMITKEEVAESAAKRVAVKEEEPGKTLATKEEEEEVVVEKAVEAEGKEEKKEEKGYTPHQKPETTPEVRRALALRRRITARHPPFIRQEAYNYIRLGMKWRQPRGGQSKMRRHWKYRPNVVSIGYRTPVAARGLHPSGFAEVLVHNPGGLDGLDPKRQAVRIAHTVGRKKHGEIVKRAGEMGLRVLNPRGEG